MNCAVVGTVASFPRTTTLGADVHRAAAVHAGQRHDRTAWWRRRTAWSAGSPGSSEGSFDVGRNPRSSSPSIRRARARGTRPMSRSGGCGNRSMRRGLGADHMSTPPWRASTAARSPRRRTRSGRAGRGRRRPAREVVGDLGARARGRATISAWGLPCGTSGVVGVLGSDAALEDRCRRRGSCRCRCGPGRSGRCPGGRRTGSSDLDGERDDVGAEGGRRSGEHPERLEGGQARSLCESAGVYRLRFGRAGPVERPPRTYMGRARVLEATPAVITAVYR